ncbi:MAG: hypothetical protein M5U28_15440 [Sandaracinaceae bacterium]|nr:hypothetical protein [Sandaracinaceae bacterium]
MAGAEVDGVLARLNPDDHAGPELERRDPVALGGALAVRTKPGHPAQPTVRQDPNHARTVPKRIVEGDQQITLR